MKQDKLSVGLCSFAISGLLLFAVAPVVFAQGGTGSSDVMINNTTATTTPAPVTKDDTLEPTVKVDSQRVEDRVKQSRAEGLAKLSELRAGKKEKTAEQRLKICEVRKTSIDNKLSAFDNHAGQKLAQFNTIFTRVQTFKSEKQLQVTNYVALVGTATQKQTIAAESVAALKALTASFDCSTTDPAATVAAIKAAASDTRAALQAYRQAIKDIVVALAQVNKTSKAGDSSATGTDTSTTTGTN